MMSSVHSNVSEDESYHYSSQSACTAIVESTIYATTGITFAPDVVFLTVVSSKVPGKSVHRYLAHRELACSTCHGHCYLRNAHTGQ